MNPRPIIIAGICAVLFIAVVYFIGKHVLEQGRVTSTYDLSTVSKTKQKNRRTTFPTESSPSNTPMTNKSTDGQQTRVTEQPDLIVDTEASTTTLGTETPQTEDEPVSPFGFGPYPKIPDDYPHLKDWKETQKHPADELMDRVMLKAWLEGNREFTGGLIEFTNGKVYLTSPGMAYVELEERTLKDGTTAMMVTGSIGNLPPMPPMLKGPTYVKDLEDLSNRWGIRIIDYESGGIESYEYLGLPEILPLREMH